MTCKASHAPCIRVSAGQNVGRTLSLSQLIEVEGDVIGALAGRVLLNGNIASIGDDTSTWHEYRVIDAAQLHYQSDLLIAEYPPADENLMATRCITSSNAKDEIDNPYTMAELLAAWRDGDTLALWAAQQSGQRTAYTSNAEDWEEEFIIIDDAAFDAQARRALAYDCLALTS